MTEGSTFHLSDPSHNTVLDSFIHDSNAVGHIFRLYLERHEFIQIVILIE